MKRQAVVLALAWALLADNAFAEKLKGYLWEVSASSIVVEGQVVGAIGVSGASSAARDAAIALAGAAALGGKTSAAR